MYLNGACFRWVGGKGRNKNYVLIITQVYKTRRTFVIQVVANSSRFRIVIRHIIIIGTLHQ